MARFTDLVRLISFRKGGTRGAMVWGGGIDLASYQETYPGRGGIVDRSHHGRLSNHADDRRWEHERRTRRENRE